MNREEREGREVLAPELRAATRSIVDSGLQVHRALGPGLLESAYEHCLFHELTSRGHRVRRQVVMPIEYQGATLDAGYRLDLLVEEAVIIEIKAIDTLTPVHMAQMITYLRLSGCPIGFLMNFNVVLFKQGLRRVVPGAAPSRVNS